MHTNVAIFVPTAGPARPIVRNSFFNNLFTTTPENAKSEKLTGPPPPVGLRVAYKTTSLSKCASSREKEC